MWRSISYTNIVLFVPVILRDQLIRITDNPLTDQTYFQLINLCTQNRRLLKETSLEFFFAIRQSWFWELSCKIRTANESHPCYTETRELNQLPQCNYNKMKKNYQGRNVCWMVCELIWITSTTISNPSTTILFKWCFVVFRSRQFIYSGVLGRVLLSFMPFYGILQIIRWQETLAGHF